jgi:hypothetical protein
LFFLNTGALRLHIIKRGVEFLGNPLTGNDTVSMGESEYEEIAVCSGHCDYAERRDGVQDMRLVQASDRAGAVSTHRDVLESLRYAERLRSLRMFGQRSDDDRRALVPLARSFCLCRVE